MLLGGWERGEQTNKQTNKQRERETGRGGGGGGTKCQDQLVHPTGPRKGEQDMALEEALEESPRRHTPPYVLDCRNGFAFTS